MASELQLIVHRPGRSSVIDDAVEMLRQLEARWSRFLPDSDISRINLEAGTPVTVSTSTIALMTTMREAWELTQGRYDPTILPVLMANGYAASRVDPSAVTQLAPGPHRVGGMDEIIVDRDRSTVMVPVGVALDPGGIGKGLAADTAVASLLEEGAHGALVSIGGDLSAAGTAPDPDGWRIDIERAEPDTTPLFGVTLDQGGVATSSTRSRRWQHDGRTTHHAIDPATGAVSDTDLAAVTVVSTSGWRAEAFATAALLAGSGSVIDYLDSHDLSGVAIADTGAILRTSDLDDLAVSTEAAAP